MVLPKRKTTLASVLSKPGKSKYSLPKSSKPKVGGFASKARAISLGFAVGAAGLFGAKAVQQRRVKIESQRAGIEQVIRVENVVRNPRVWSKISRIYKWDPKTSHGLARINFIEELSKRTGVTPKNILLTLEQNTFSKREDVHQRIWEIRNSMKKGSPTELARKNRVISVLLESLKIAETNSIVGQVEKEMRNTRGSLRAIKEL